jgi:hypothetical protein
MESNQVEISKPSSVILNSFKRIPSCEGPYGHQSSLIQFNPSFIPKNEPKAFMYPLKYPAFAQGSLQHNFYLE